jgi:hypothetical protein
VCSRHTLATPLRLCLYASQARQQRLIEAKDIANLNARTMRTASVVDAMRDSLSVSAGSSDGGGDGDGGEVVAGERSFTVHVSETGSLGAFFRQLWGAYRRFVSFRFVSFRFVSFRFVSVSFRCCLLCFCVHCST